MSLIKQIKLEDNLYDIGAKWSNIDKENIVYEPSEIVSFEDNKIELLKKCIINIKAVQEGSGDPSPANIRPISGWTGARVTSAGKNLLPLTIDSIKAVSTAGTWSGNVYSIGGLTFTFLADEDGHVTGIDVNGTSTETTGMTLIGKRDKLALRPGNFILTGCTGGQGGANYTYYLWATGYGATIAQAISTATVVITEEQKNVQIGISVNSGVTMDHVMFYPMLRPEADTVATFEPYRGTIHDFAWESEAGTVYGGTLNVQTGELMVNRKGYVFDGTENWGQFWDAPQRIFRFIRNGQVKTLTGRASSHFANAQVTSGTTDIGYYAYNGTANSIYIQFRPNLDDIPDLESWKAWLATQAQAGTPLTCYHTIATPQVYHLTPIEISTLLGENNIWADCGDISIELENFYSDIQTEITTNLNENTLLYKNNNSLISSNILIENDDLYFSKLDTYSPPRIFVSLNSDNKTYRNMDIGWTYSLGNGAVLGLREEHFPDTPGAFFLCARRTLIENENTSILTTQFRGTSEGSITISNNDNTACLNINTSMSSTINPKNYNLYVNGTTYLKGDTKISANTSTVGCTLQYDNTLNTLNFVFD